MTEGTHLTALEGTNPLGFLAALGVQALFDHEQHQPKLWWSDDIIPHAMIDPEFAVDRLVDQASHVFPQWVESPALNPGFGTKADDTAKFARDQIRPYLERTRSQTPGNRLAAALVAEGSLDGKGNAKPTDLYFMAGPLRFLKIAREILGTVSSEELRDGLTGPWRGESDLSSLKWDVTGDISYAIAVSKPGVDKGSSPGPESLALLGLSRHASFLGFMNGKSRTLTVGCEGLWSRGGTYTWPLWSNPASPSAVLSILTHASATGDQLRQRSIWYRAWGISRVLTSTIRRSAEGGYGTFGPPRIIWPT